MQQHTLNSFEAILEVKDDLLRFSHMNLNEYVLCTAIYRLNNRLSSLYLVKCLQKNHTPTCRMQTTLWAVDAGAVFVVSSSHTDMIRAMKWSGFQWFSLRICGRIYQH